MKCAFIGTSHKPAA